MPQRYRRNQTVRLARTRRRPRSPHPLIGVDIQLGVSAQGASWSTPGPHNTTRKAHPTPPHPLPDLQTRRSAQFAPAHHPSPTQHPTVWRTVPRTAITQTAPALHLSRSGAVSAAWRVMDSNQRRTTPTVLQSIQAPTRTGASPARSRPGHAHPRTWSTPGPQPPSAPAAPFPALRPARRCGHGTTGSSLRLDQAFGVGATKVDHDVGQLNGTINGRQLASDPDGVNEPRRGDQVAIVGPADDPHRQLIPQPGECLDDVEQIAGGELGGRGLTLRATLTRKLQVELLDQAGQDPDDAPGHEPWPRSRSSRARCRSSSSAPISSRRRRIPGRRVVGSSTMDV
jgi:hypothetical protein